MSPLEQSKLPFFYLEKTERSDQVRLVHRRHYGKNRSGTEEERQLLPPKSHPVGFRSGGNTFLFDSQLGCVYILTQLPSSLTKAYQETEEDLTISRKSLPFEEFFKCGNDYRRTENFPYPANRCQTVIGSTFPDLSSMPPVTDREFVYSWLLLLFGLFIFLLLVVSICFYAWPEFRKACKLRKQLPKKRELKKVSTQKLTRTSSPSTLVKNGNIDGTSTLANSKINKFKVRVVIKDTTSKSPKSRYVASSTTDTTDTESRESTHFKYSAKQTLPLSKKKSPVSATMSAML